MKILLENERIFPYATGGSVSGGAERQQWLLSRALADRGHEVVVYSRSNESCDDRQIEGVQFRWISSRSPIVAWPRILRRERPDWWYYRCADYYLGVLTPMAHLAGVKVAFACAHDNDCRPRVALTRRKYLWPLYASGLRGADRILVQHQSQKGLLDSGLQGKAALVSSISDVVAQKVDREDHIVWIAVLRETKRPHLLVEIARLLPEIRFVVCGATSLSYTTPAYARGIVDLLKSCPNIDYRGKVPPGEAQDLIRSAAMFLSTSESEGFPNTFLQAWGGGVPVVSVQLDPAGVIAKHEAGIVAADVQSAAEGIRRLLQDGDLNRRMGLNGRSYVAQTHGDEVVAGQILAALSLRS